jgi:thioredoxin-dependent peroxiredoxin
MTALCVSSVTGAVTLKVGDPAPPFSLPGSDGKVHSLASYKGKQVVVLAWFTKAYSDACTAECKSLRESGDEIRVFDATYFAVSVDRADTNRAFARSLGLDYPLLSDPFKSIAKAYGVVDEDQPFASRWTFYIGADGRILYVDKQVSPGTQGKTIAVRLSELGISQRRPSR